MGLRGAADCGEGFHPALPRAPHRPHSHHEARLHRDQWGQLPTDPAAAAQHGLQVPHPEPRSPGAAVPLGVLRLLPDHLWHLHQPDPQVVPHLRRAAELGGLPAGLAHPPAPQAPPHPPRVPARDLLLHHHRLAELPAGEDTLLATLGGPHPGPDGRETSGRRHEVGPEDQVTSQTCPWMPASPSLELKPSAKSQPGGGGPASGQGLSWAGPGTPAHPHDRILEPLTYHFLSPCLSWAPPQAPELLSQSLTLQKAREPHSPSTPHRPPCPRGSPSVAVWE